jgi:hypothetical protein
MNEIVTAIQSCFKASTLPSSIKGGLWRDSVPTGTIAPYAVLYSVRGKGTDHAFPVTGGNGTEPIIEPYRFQFSVLSETDAAPLIDLLTSVFDNSSNIPALSSGLFLMSHRLYPPVCYRDPVERDADGNSLYRANVVYDFYVQP